MGGLVSERPIGPADQGFSGVGGWITWLRGGDGRHTDLTYTGLNVAPRMGNEALLVGENGEALPKNRSEEKCWSKAVRHRRPIVSMERSALFLPARSTRNRCLRRSGSKATGCSSIMNQSIGFVHESYVKTTGFARPPLELAGFANGIRGSWLIIRCWW